MEEPEKWKIKQERFIAFFDIMGFKDLVQKNSHENIVDKLSNLRSNMAQINKVKNAKLFEDFGVENSQTKWITFSDSLIIFSKGNELKDLIKIIVEASYILFTSIQDGLPIKGAISCGTLTVDFENSMFFGQSLIDAYLLHDELEMYNAIIDHSAEAKIKSFGDVPILKKMITNYRVPMRSGRITHQVLKPINEEYLKKYLDSVEKLYTTVSGRPRIYIDNSLDFFKSFSK